MLWCLKKLVVARVRKGKLGRDVFCGKSKTLCLTNNGDRFITAPYKPCQPQPPKLERQGLNPTHIPIHSSDLAFSPKIIFLQPIQKTFSKKCNIFWYFENTDIIWSDARKIGLLSRQNSPRSHQTLLWDNDVGRLFGGKWQKQHASMTCVEKWDSGDNSSCLVWRALGKFWTAAYYKSKSGPLHIMRKTTCHSAFYWQICYYVYHQFIIMQLCISMLS